MLLGPFLILETNMLVLDYVSFTGLDDNTNITEFVKLCDDYKTPIAPALLYFPEKMGQQRNPSLNTLDEIVEVFNDGSFDIHLCGEQVFNDILSGTVPRQLYHATNVQININARRKTFSDQDVMEIYQILYNEGIPLILQYHEASRGVVEAFAYRYVISTPPRVLHDASRGKGIAPTTWPRMMPGRVTGYAGGLNPHNIAQANAQILEVNKDHYAEDYLYYWLDMESGVRTIDNEFSVDKCRQVMEALGVE